MNWRAYTAEFLGAAVLTCAVLTALTVDLPVATPIIAGLTLGLFVYTIGNISGSHINPAVTIGLLSVNQINAQEAGKYIVAQVLGALAAMFVHSQSALGLPSIEAGHSMDILIAEAMGTFLLVFGISAVVHKKVEGAAAGIVIGGSLALGILVASASSNGVLNPAVAIGIGSVSLSYLIGPFVGAALAALLYKWLVTK